MTAKDGLLYSESHEWIKADGEGYLVGLTDYAVKELGDIVFIDLPENGITVTAGDSICEVESVKAVSEVYAPLSGEIVDVHAELADSPEDISGAPYDSWLFRMTGTPDAGFMSPEEYTTFCEGL